MEYWIWLASGSGLSVRTQHLLLGYFSTPEAIFHAPLNAFERVTGLSDRAKTALADRKITCARKILDDCRRMRIGVLTWQDAQYPARLKNIPEPPLVLYYFGYLPDDRNYPAIGVVGTRNASPEGNRTAVRLGRELGGSGGIVVSGMAAGIDSSAVYGALEAGAPVIGVVGGGIDVVYPASNRELYRRVAKAGCLLTEYPPGSRPTKWTFPRRNRIISGLSLGVLVVEAPVSSGAMITARWAREQGRMVFAVPGSPELACAAGSNELLLDGAIPVLRGWDILRLYAEIYPNITPPKPETVSLGEGKRQPSPTKNKKKIDNPSSPPYIDQEKDLGDEEKVILKFLAQGAQSYDDVLAFAGLAPGDAIMAISMLELRGLLRHLPGDLIALQEK